ncbi:MAG: DNA double-strand break repair nuclease NurA [Candidatus Aenigmatarchaeota archaeon]
MAFETEIEGITAALVSEKLDEIEKLRTIIKEVENYTKSIRDEIILKIGTPKKDDLKKDIIAVDGSSYQEQFDSITVTIATAYIYSQKKIEERHLPTIKILAPYYASLITSVNMKNLEYKIVLDLLKENKISPDLILLDGSICFPDEALANYIDNVPLMKEAYNEYKETTNDFYKLILKEGIPTLALSKDPTANKYLIAIYKSLSDPSEHDEINPNSLKNLGFVKKLNNKNIYNLVSENAFIKKLMANRLFVRTKYLEITRSLRNDLPVKILRNNVCGFYFKTIDEQRPFFVEMPAYFKDNIDELTQLLSSLSYYSLRRGYPFPLYVAHKRVSLKKKYCKNIVTLVRNIASNELGKDYIDIFEPIFHDKL